MLERLSWDLFVIVFLVTIIAYSFIIGRNNTLKVIVGTYIAALAADAIGNIFGLYFTGSKFVAKVFNNSIVANDLEAVILLKVFLFIVLVILFSVKSAFSVNTDSNRSGVIRLAILFLLGFLCAAFIMSTLIVYASGVSFVSGSVTGINTEMTLLFKESRLIKILAQYYNFWFALPAFALIGASFLFNSRND